MALRCNNFKCLPDIYLAWLARASLFLTALVVAGCAASTVAPADPVVVKQVLPFIQDGKTTKKEVLNRLGDPDYRHEGGRILAYKMWMCAREEQVPFTEETRCMDSGAYNLVLVFGPQNLVEKHSLVRVK
ncbi:MAG TPA: hypothetical protein VEG25_05405 [Burkholderiales bacterium]|nr:hypothetical protein [Burkholderiales bacterium]